MRHGAAFLLPGTTTFRHFYINYDLIWQLNWHRSKMEWWQFWLFFSFLFFSEVLWTQHYGCSFWWMRTNENTCRRCTFFFILSQLKRQNLVLLRPEPEIIQVRVLSGYHHHHHHHSISDADCPNDGTPSTLMSLLHFLATLLIFNSILLTLL